MDLHTILISKLVTLSPCKTYLIPLPTVKLSYSINSIGYEVVYINSTPYLLHRILIALQTGKWPSVVDHKNGDKLNNSPTNIRSCTSSDNNCNRGMRSDNTIGYKGLFIRQTRKGLVYGWMIRYAGRSVSKSGFKTPEAAFKSRQEALHIAHGEFYNDGST
jgi:hypothetical protein